MMAFLRIIFSLSVIPLLCLASKSQSRIINGTDAELGQFPYVVSVQFSNDPNVDTFSYICTGAIISEEWILTTAGCFEFSNTGFFRIVAGTHRMNLRNDSQSVLVERVVKHPEYRGGPNDIALLKLQKKLLFTKTVGKIDLPGRNQDFVGNGTFCTWSSMHNTNGISTGKLKTAILPILPNDVCSMKLQDINNLNLSTNMCTVSSINGAIPCIGDAGGSLVQNGVLIGVHSWGISPCRPDYPDVFTRISVFIDFIKKVISNKAQLNRSSSCIIITLYFIANLLKH